MPAQDIRLGQRVLSGLDAQEQARLLRIIGDLGGLNFLRENALLGERGQFGRGQLASLERMIRRQGLLRNPGRVNFITDVLGRLQAVPPPDRSRFPTLPDPVLRVPAGGGGGGNRNPRDPREPGGNFGPPGFPIVGPIGPGGLQITGTPQSDLINQMFADLFAGHQPPRQIDALPPDIAGRIQDALLARIQASPEDVSALSPAMRASLESTLQRLLSGEAFAPEVGDRLENRVRENLAVRERNLINRRGDEFAARGTFAGGPQRFDAGGIERNITSELANQLSQIGFFEAQASERARQAGVGGTLGLGQIGLGERSLLERIQQSGTQGLLGLGALNLDAQRLGIQEALQQRGLDIDTLRTAISRELGLGGLERDLLGLELQRQLQEIFLNLELLQNFFGSGGEGDAGDTFAQLFPPGFEFPRPGSGQFFNF